MRIHNNIKPKSKLGNVAEAKCETDAKNSILGRYGFNTMPPCLFDPSSSVQRYKPFSDHCSDVSYLGTLKITELN